MSRLLLLSLLALAPIPANASTPGLPLARALDLTEHLSQQEQTEGGHRYRMDQRPTPVVEREPCDFATLGYSFEPRGARTPDSAECTLRRSENFIEASGGFVVLEPRQAAAFRFLLQVPDGAERFRRVLASGEMGGKLYALCGLFFLDPVAFERELPRIWREDGDKQLQEPVDTSCESSNRKVSVREYLGAREAHTMSPAEWQARVFRREARSHEIRVTPDEEDPVFGLRDIASGTACYKIRDGWPGDGRAQ